MAVQYSLSWQPSTASHGSTAQRGSYTAWHYTYSPAHGSPVQPPFAVQPHGGSVEILIAVEPMVV